MAKAVHLNPDRDPHLLYFLWRWKFAPSVVLFQKFFPEATFATAYNRLLKLEKVGYIQSCILDKTYRGNVWMLGSLGYKAVKSMLPRLAEDGFKSENMIHDLLVNAVHCGEFNSNSPKHCTLFTEQEIRRYALGEYPEGVPKTDLHRPDGYWVFRNGEESCTLALEVELNYKEDLRYGLTARFYETCEGISGVIWIVKTEAMAKRIISAMKDGIEGENFGHSFIELSEFLHRGWQARVGIGENVGATLGSLTHRSDMDLPMDSPCSPMTHPWLDVRKNPLKPDICNRLNILQF